MTSEDELRSRLKERGVQITAQRIAVLRAVGAAPHATADDIIATVRSTLGAISKQAVYDTLRVFVDKQLVRRIQPSGSAARFETRVGDNHHHLICRGCRLMFDFDCVVGAQPCLTVDDDHGFTIDEAEVICWGYCPACQTHPPKDD